jgi:chorismate mutase
MNTDLQTLRNEIDKIDASIIELLSQRKNLSEAIGKLKVTLEKEIVDVNRENYLKARYVKLSEKYHLSAEFIINLFKIIIQNSRDCQK